MANPPFVGSGLSTQLVANNESTFGVAASLSSNHPYEIKSESLELKKTTVQGQGLAAGRLYDRTKRRVLTNYDVAGSLVMDCPSRQLAFWLQYMLGAFGQSLNTPTSMGGGLYYSVFQGVGGQQTTGTQLGHSLTIQKGVAEATPGGSTIDPFTYVGMKVTDWELKCAVGQIAELTLNFDGRNELAGAYPNGGVGSSNDPLNASTPSLATWAGPPTNGQGCAPFHFRQANILTNAGGATWGAAPFGSGNIATLASSSTMASVKDISIKHSVKFDDKRIFLGGGGFKAEQIENGFRSITGTMTVEWLSPTYYYNAFAGDITTWLELKFVGPTVGSYTYLLDVVLPNIKLDGESPKVGGPAVVNQTVGFTAFDDETTVPIQITYQSEDSAI